MSEGQGQKDQRQPRTHDVELKARASVSAKLDAVIVTLEERLTPTFKKMAMGRLYRISKGEDLIISGAEGLPKEPIKLLAQHWYDMRRREKDHDLAQQSINIARGSARWGKWGFAISIIAAAAAIAAVVISAIKS